MKLLIVVTALFAVAAAEESRAKRSAVYGYGHGYGATVKGGSAVISGPSGVISADTGAIASAPGGYGHVVAPAAVYGAAPAVLTTAAAHHTPTVYAGPAQTAGAIVSPGAVLVGPSTDGRPGVVAAKGHYDHGYHYGAGLVNGFYGAGYGLHGAHGHFYG